jgi:hypothetical protein
VHLAYLRCNTRPSEAEAQFIIFCLPSLSIQAKTTHPEPVLSTDWYRHIFELELALLVNFCSYDVSVPISFLVLTFVAHLVLLTGFPWL